MGVLLAACRDSTPPQQPETVDATVTYVLIMNVIGLTGGTTTSASINASSLSYRDANDPCRGLYSIHAEPTTVVTYTDATDVVVPLATIGIGSKIRFPLATAVSTSCGTSVTPASISIVRP
jgi:hypothetical protein